MKRFVRAAAAAAVATAAVACAPPQQTAQSSSAAPAGAWHSLFDGKTMNQWRGYRDGDISNWRVEDGTITKTGNPADIITRVPYANFELELDWKISAGGNSGIFYRATEEYEHIYWSAPEFQILDDAGAADGKNRLTAAGAAYAVYPSPAGVEKPAGEWNTARLVVNGNHVEHWLNGRKLLDYDLGSPDWAARVARSKFAKWPDYGKATIGYIGVQGDEDGTLSLRNIRIRELH